MTYKDGDTRTQCEQVDQFYSLTSKVLADQPVAKMDVRIDDLYSCDDCYRVISITNVTESTIYCQTVRTAYWQYDIDSMSWSNFLSRNPVLIRRASPYDPTVPLSMYIPRVEWTLDVPCYRQEWRRVNCYSSDVGYWIAWQSRPVGRGDWVDMTHVPKSVLGMYARWRNKR